MNYVKYRNLLVLFTLTVVMILSAAMIYISVNKTKDFVLERFNLVCQEITSNYFPNYNNSDDIVSYQFDEKYDKIVESCNDDFLNAFSFKIIDISVSKYIYSSSKNDRIFDQDNNTISYYDLSSDDLLNFCGEIRKSVNAYIGTCKYSEKDIKYIANYKVVDENNRLLLFSMPEKNLYRLWGRDYLFLAFIFIAFVGQIVLLIIVIKGRSEKNNEQESNVSDRENEEVRSDKVYIPHKIPELPIKKIASPVDELKIKTESLCVFCIKQKGTYDLMGKQVCSDCRDKLMTKLYEMK